NCLGFIYLSRAMVWSFFCFCFGFIPVWRVCLIPTAIKHLPFLYHEHLRRCLQFFLYCHNAGHPTHTHTHTYTHAPTHTPTTHHNTHPPPSPPHTHMPTHTHIHTHTHTHTHISC